MVDMKSLSFYFQHKVKLKKKKKLFIILQHSLNFKVIYFINSLKYNALEFFFNYKNCFKNVGGGLKAYASSSGTIFIINVPISPEKCYLII